MSALDIIKIPGCAIVITDAGSFNVDSGELISLGVKQASVPHWPGVVATRGAPLATPLYGHLLGLKFKTWDEAVAGIESVIRDVHEEVEKLCASHGHPGIVEPVDLAGWSRTRNRPESYTIAVTSEPPSSMTLEDEKPESKARFIESEPFKLFPLKSLALAPLVSQEELERTGILDASRLNGPERLRAVIALVEAQRRNLYCSRDGSAPPFSGIGGWVLSSVVTADGIAQKIIHRWDDKIGKRIDVANEGRDLGLLVRKSTGNGKAPAPIVVGIGGSRTHQGDQVDLGPYVAPTTEGPVATTRPEAPPELPSGMDLPGNVFANAPYVSAETAGPPYGGYEPFAMEGYPNTYASPAGPEYAGYEPFATEGNYPFANEPFATGANVAYPGPGFPVGPVERGAEELFPPMERTVRSDYEGYPPNPVGPVEYGGPLGRVTNEAGTVLGGQPVDPLTGYPVEPVEHAGELYPPMDYVAPPQPTGMIGPDRPPTEPQGPELPSYEQMLAGISIPPQIAPAQEVERTPLDEITGEAFATGEGVEYPPGDEEMARRAQEEEFVSPEMQRDAIAAERYTAPVGPLSPPQARDAVTFDRNARVALSNVPSDIQNKIAPYLEQMTPREKVDLITGRTTVLEIFAQKSGYSINDVRGYLDKNYPGGAVQLQADLTRPGERVGPIALQSEALPESVVPQAPPDMPPIATTRPEQPVPGMDIEFPGLWANTPPMMTPTEPPPWPGISQPGLYPPGVHEIPPPSMPTGPAPGIPSVPSPGVSIPNAPVDYAGGASYPGAPSSAEVSYFLESQPAEVEMVARRFGVSLVTAAMMLAAQAQSAAEGGRVAATPDFWARTHEEAERENPFAAIANSLRIKPRSWDRWFADLPETGEIEDRRTNDPTMSDEEKLRAMGIHYRKEWK